MVRLGEVCDHSLGKMLDRNKNRGVPRPYLRNPNVQWFDFDLTDVRQIPIEDDERDKYLVRPGDIIVCEGGEAGRAAIWEGQLDEVYIQKALHRVRAKPELNSRFLVYRLMADAKSGRLEHYFTGTTIPHFTGQDLDRYTFPLPPLAEQKRIADLLDKADAIRRRREESIEQTEQLSRSTFLATFGDPATNPKKWPIRIMGDVVKETQYGTAEKSNTDRRGLPVLRMNNITYGGEFDLTDLKWCEIGNAELDQLTVKRGDLLFNRTNSPELVGKTAVWDRDETYAYAGYLFRVRFHENIVLPDYASAFLNSDYGKRMLFAKAKPSNNMSNLSAGTFCRIRVPVPDLSVQARFVESLTDMKGMKTTRRAALKESIDLANGLTQRAFRGEL